MTIGDSENKGRAHQNPYVGPRSFEEQESQFFFGRDQETEILTGLVMARRAALFFAQSGAGKSSLLRAGLIPELTRQETMGRGRRARQVQKMRVLPVLNVGGAVPGDMAQQIDNIYIFGALFSLQPDAKADALAGLSLVEGLAPLFAAPEPDPEQPVPPPSSLPTLLIFDQFEELFTHHTARWTERKGFFEQVSVALSTYSTLHVLFTMREDYIAELTPYVGLLPEQLRSRFRLERLQREDALEAIQQPAEQAGCPFAPGVAETLVDNLRRAQPGQKTAVRATQAADAPARPLGAYVEPVHLQIVCRQLWDNLPPDRSEILDEDLARLGDVDQALIGFYEDTLQAVLENVDTSERRLRNWFNDPLITPARTRGLVYRGTFDTQGLPNRAIDVLNEAYIIRANRRGNDTWYELAHDRLVEPILAANYEWLTRYQNPLTRAAEDWQNAGRDPAKLYKSDQLEEIQTQIDPDELTELENEFIAACEEAAQLKRNQRLGRIILGGGILLVVFALLTIWSITSAVSANRLNAISEARWWSFVSIDNLDQNPDLSVLLSVHAVDRITRVRKTEDTIEPENALHRALHRSKASGYQHTLQHQYQVAINSIAFSPDGQTLGTAADDGTVHLWDVELGSLNQPLDAHTGPARRIAFSPDGGTLATAGADQRVVLWDAQSYELLAELTGHSTEVYRLAFSPDGQYLATGDAHGIVKVWQIETRDLLFSLPAHTDAISHITFSPDGTKLATASADKTARVWNADPNFQTSGQSATDFERALFPLTGHTGSIKDITFSPDGKKLATASADKTARIWSAESGGELKILFGHSANVSDIAFSPGGEFLATTSADGTTKLWNTSTWREQASLAQTGPVSPVNRVTFGPDGTRLAATSEDGTVRIWSLPSGKELLVLSDHQGNLTSLAFGVHGAYLASAGADGVAYLYAMDVVRLLEIACGQTSRNLTLDEWHNYIGASRYRQTCDDLPMHDSAILEFIRDRPGAVRKYVRNGWLTPRMIRDVSEQQMARVLVELAREHITKDNVQAAMTALEQAQELQSDLSVKELATVYASVCALANPADLNEDVQAACARAVALAVQTDSLSLNQSICQSSRVEALAQTVLPACQKAETLKKTEDLAIEFIESPNFSERPPGTKIRLIVVGATKNDSLSSTTLEFQNPQTSKSAHYAIDKDGKIVQYVDDGNRASHSAKSEWEGASNVNDFSIGIQLVNLNDGQDPYPESQRQALIDLCVNLANKYDIPASHIVGRYEISQAGETDPLDLNMDTLRGDVENVLSTLNSYEQATNDIERLQGFADLFALGSIYTQEALNRFYSLEPAQQVSLFPADASAEIGQEIETVIKGVYVTLDWLDKGQDLAIMDAMIHSLQSVDAQAYKDLIDEIGYWKTGREYDAAEQYQEAVDAYGQAIALNSDHPVILFDQAMVYTELEQYAQALDNLSKIYRLAAAQQEQETTTQIAAQITLPQTGTAGIEMQQRFTNPARILETVQTILQQDDDLATYLKAYAQGYPALSSLVVIVPSQAQTIFGLHDPGGESLMVGMGRTGWIVFPEMVLRDPKDFGSVDYGEWDNAGFGVIVRIDHDQFPGGTIPRRESYDDFAQRVRNFVQESDDAYIWILGNHPNSPQSYPEKQPITPQLYAECYKKVWDQIHSLPDHENDQLVVAPIEPGNASTKYQGNEDGDWVQYFSDVLNEIQKLGGTVDAIALHTYTHGAATNLITSEDRMEPPFQDRYYHFYAYRDFMEAIPPNLRAVPVYITETHQDNPWMDANTGWVQAAYQEIDGWNNTPGSQQIRALILYQWPRYGDFNIDGKKGVQDDFQAAMENDYTWAASSTSGTGPDQPMATATATPPPTPTPIPIKVGDLEVDFIESPHHNERPYDTDIWALIIHASANDSLDAFVRAAQNPQSPYSVHYVIGKDGRVIQMVDDEMRAWHSGKSEWKGVPDVNDFAIGIELINLNDGQDLYPREQFETLVALCVELVEKYGIDPTDIVGHYNVSQSGKTDPVGLDIKMLQREVASRVTPEPTSTPTATPAAPPTATPTPTAAVQTEIVKPPRYIFGLHEPGGEWLMAEMGKNGWIVFPERVLHDPQERSSRDYSEWTDNGFGVIVRIDHDYYPNGTIPDPDYDDDFALRIGNFVANSTGAHVWIIGQEPNRATSRPDGQAITPERYAECYHKVWKQIHSIPGHENDQVVVAPIAPWNVETTYRGNENGDWVKYLVDVLNEIQKLGAEVDAIALHTYTHSADPDLITSDNKMARPFQDRHTDFMAYRDFMNAIPRALRHVPVYITETNQGNLWLDENNGWVQAAYKEIDDWNNTPGNQQIRTLVLYRWPKVDGWHIEDKQGVYKDLLSAMEHEYVWLDQPLPVVATATPTPASLSCDVEPPKEMYKVWKKHQAQLGCPVQKEPTDSDAVEQPFENGYMIWSQALDWMLILVKNDEQLALVNKEKWDHADAGCTPKVKPAPGLVTVQPEGGFGSLWCNRTDIQELVGFGLAKEYRTSDNLIMEFERGLILLNQDQVPLILLHVDGERYTWIEE